MTTQLLVAPAGAGKTAYVIDLLREAARDLQSTPRVVVPTHLQVRAMRRRLAAAGGAIGVRVLTFDRLYHECLNAAGEIYTELSDPIMHRLIRSVVDDLLPAYYAPLTRRPGFIQILDRLIGELKAARVHPDAFKEAVIALGNEPRLAELAGIYAAYQAQLQTGVWADRAGLGWLAVESLEERSPDVALDWSLLVFDGFDSFTPVQLDMMRLLAGRAAQTVITLTGDANGDKRPLAHGRFTKTCSLVEAALGIQSVGLPGGPVSRYAPALDHLEAGLFRSNVDEMDAGGAVEQVEAPDCAAEVRAAMRWLKTRLVSDDTRPGDVALLARKIAPYRPFILQIASEFGLPIRLVDGQPLRANPAIAALMELLRLMLPHGNDDPEPALSRRQVVEAWRSPYFDWSALPAEDAGAPIGITLADADALDAVAREGRVIGGLSQWIETLDRQTAREADADAGEEDLRLDESEEIGADAPAGVAAESLRDKFDRFVERLAPPPDGCTYRTFVGWLETLIGPDPDLQSPLFPQPDEPTALQLVARARATSEQIAERDVAALQALKDILRGLVWAEESLGKPGCVTYPQFIDELAGAIDAASYRLPMHADREEIIVADVVQSRGLPFRAVAVLGLAEGEFPSGVSEDVFLRDTDRQRLREEFELPLEPSIESAEAEFFYETITRARERLLLTRPRLADNGALWPASPFWEWVNRLLILTCHTLTSDGLPIPSLAASPPEWVESLAACADDDALRATLAGRPDRLAGLERATLVLDARRRDARGSPYDGGLKSMSETFKRHFGPSHVWSGSQLETYHACPFRLLIGKVMHLEPRPEPMEGLDAAQLGNIYHHILEKVYQDPLVDDPTDLDQLLDALPRVAKEELDAAPEDQGFRETAWWGQTRDEIVENVRLSLEALHTLSHEFAPYQHEASFGIGDAPALILRADDDELRVRGYIDRVDRDPDGNLRIIDYKTAGPSAFSNAALSQGKKLQLPLYAMAARDALGLGEPADGFYWHVRHAEPSKFTLRGFAAGPQGAMDLVTEIAWDVARGARSGHFQPQRPADGCPSYCAAVGFCWHYQPGFGG